MMDDRISVFLVDDHQVVRQGLKMYFALDSRIDVVGEANHGEEALHLIPLVKPKVVIMDLVMPVMDGIQATRVLKKMHPEIEVIALTSGLEEHRIHAAIDAGVIGYMLKDASAEMLLKMVHASARGEVWFHPEAAKRLVRGFRSSEMRDTLTGREALVLQLIAKGWTNKMITLELGISETTVKTHVSSLLDKLGVTTRTQAALYALKHGLADLG